MEYPLAKKICLENDPFSEPWKSSDVIIIVKDKDEPFKFNSEKKLHVHSNILSMAIPVFEQMLNSNFKEGLTKEIKLPTKLYKHMLVFLKIIYPQFVHNLGM